MAIRFMSKLCQVQYSKQSIKILENGNYMQHLENIHKAASVAYCIKKFNIKR